MIGQQTAGLRRNSCSRYHQTVDPQYSIIKFILHCDNLRAWTNCWPVKIENHSKKEKPNMLYQYCLSVGDYQDIQMKQIRSHQCSIELIPINQKKNRMGCSESQLRNLEQTLKPQHREFAQIRAVYADQDSFEVQQGVKQNAKAAKQAVMNVVDVSMISKQNEQNSTEDKEENSKIKVKKAKKYRIRPQHQRFIENILESNRAKAVTEYPPSPSLLNGLALKKSAVSLHSKLEESQADKQNAQLQKENEKKLPKNSSIETKYTRKQAQKIFNNILQGKTAIEELNQIGERIDLQQLDSNETLQL